MWENATVSKSQVLLLVYSFYDNKKFMSWSAKAKFGTCQHMYDPQTDLSTSKHQKIWRLR